MYTAITCKIRELYKYPNADKLQLAKVLGYTVIVGNDRKVGELGVLFSTDGQLSLDFLKENDLLRKDITDENGNVKRVGYFDEKGRIISQKLRGIKSEAFWVPISYFDYIVKQSQKPLPKEFFEEGYKFNSLNEIHICNKYIPKRNPRAKNENKNTEKLENSPRKYSYYANLYQHIKYDKLRDVLYTIPKNSHIVITEKIHGTSAVTGFVKVPCGGKWYHKIFNKIGINFKPKEEYKYLIGTRKVVLDGTPDPYFHDMFRYHCADKFKHALRKGETIYYEICGFTESGKLLSVKQDLNKLKKDYKNIKAFPEQMIYSYGCKENECRIFVYRITITNEDGFSYDLSTAQCIQRCSELGLDFVPVLDSFIYDGNPEALLERANKFNSEDELKPSTISSEHISEGIVLRVEDVVLKQNKQRIPLIIKHKSFVFGVLEGYLKDNINYEDPEDDVGENNE